MTQLSTRWRIRPCTHSDPVFLSFLQQRGSIGLCGWSSPCLRQPTLPWRSEKSSSWTRASRNRRSSTPPGSTESGDTFWYKLDCHCRLQSTCGYLLLVFLSVLRVCVRVCVNESDWVLREPKGNFFEVQRATIITIKFFFFLLFTRSKVCLCCNDSAYFDNDLSKPCSFRVSNPCFTGCRHALFVQKWVFVLFFKLAECVWTEKNSEKRN